MELSNVMELAVFQSELLTLGYKPTIPPQQQFLVAVCTLQVTVRLSLFCDVALSAEYQTCEREVVGSSLGRARGVETLGKFITPMCLCSPSSTRWYRPKGSDALRLGRKGRYGLCVGGR